MTRVRGPRVSLVTLVACCACATPDSAPRLPMLVIEHVGIVDVETGSVRADQTVTIAGTRIASITGAATRAPAAGSTRVDGTGRFLVPGFWDMHVHADEGALAPLLAWGVVAARDLGGDPAALRQWRAEIHSGQRLGPRLMIAGPVLAGPPATQQSERWILTSPAGARRAVDSLAALGVDFVKVWDGIPRDAYFTVVERARALRLQVVGHVPVAVGVRDAAMAGQRGIEHLEFLPRDCLATLGPRSGSAPSAACTPAALDSLISLLSARSVWLDPTISMFRAYVPADAYAEILAGFARLTPVLRARGVRLLTGTDAEDQRIRAGETLHDEFALLVEAGFTPAEVLRAATIEPARFAGLDSATGSVAVGKWADLVLLDGDPLQSITNTRRIASVIRQGRLFTRTQLDSLLTARSTTPP